jgi:hypothetical protein
LLESVVEPPKVKFAGFLSSVLGVEPNEKVDELSEAFESDFVAPKTKLAGSFFSVVDDPKLNPVDGTFSNSLVFGAEKIPLSSFLTSSDLLPDLSADALPVPKANPELVPNFTCPVGLLAGEPKTAPSKGADEVAGEALANVVDAGELDAVVQGYFDSRSFKCFS